MIINNITLGMFEIYQKTLSKKISFKGYRSTFRKKSKIKSSPAKEDKGIIFKRVDLNKII